MKDIVIVPTYDRPEYLALCLDKLLAAEGSENKQIWVVRDNHSDIEQSIELSIQYSHVIGAAYYGLPPDRFRSTRREPHESYGNSFNVLAAFSEACRTEARYVYLVEDDVLVMPDFFKWHEVAQAQFRPFVSCAGRVNRSLNFQRNGREAIDESYTDPRACHASGKAYGSWAACFNAASLQLIVRELEQRDFIGKLGPGNEQDIFIQKFMLRVPVWNRTDLADWSAEVRPDELSITTITRPGFSVWPYVPRAYHMGMNSYHRNAGQKFNGSLEEKIAALRATISDPYKIRLMALLQDDVDPYPTQPIPEWSGPLFLKSDCR